MKFLAPFALLTVASFMATPLLAAEEAPPTHWLRR